VRYIKKICSAVIGVVVVGTGLLPAFMPAKAVGATGDNLIANPSFETTTSGGTAPASWHADKWGSNVATLSYLNTGHTGNHSAKVDMGVYASGDAKWYFDPVTVMAGHTYTFADYYQSNVISQVFVQYTKSGGGVVYEWLGSTVTSANWMQASYTFSAPADTVKISVYHLLNAVGWLITDDAVMSEVAAPTPAPTTSLVPNDSVEQAVAGNPNQPANWKSSTWGTNTTAFEYAAEGHTGTRSLKTTITSYTTGDSKWYFDPVTVTGGKAYDLQGFYKSSVPTNVIMVTYDANDQATYTTLATNIAASATIWQAYSKTVTMPANAKKMTIYHLIKTAGWLEIDDTTLLDPAVTPPPPPNNNLVANPSLELTVNGTAPDNWANSKWGTNTVTFDYANTGHTGNKAVKATMTSFTNGDGKWFFTPVDATPGSTYTYTEYYKSNTETEMVVQFTNSDNSTTYAWLGSVPASAAWTQLDLGFAAPPTAKKVTMLHLISAVGSLTIDDVALTRITVIAGSNPIPNPSAEQASATNPAMPDKWKTDTWGNNTTSFEYANGGHGGNKSVKITMSNYDTGDSKWIFDTIPLERGKSYRVSAWYKSNVLPHPGLKYVKDDNTIDYTNLPIMDANSNAATQWQLYGDTFTVPLNVKAVSMFFYISNNGWLQTDDYVIEPYSPVGFNRPLVSLTFDDGFEENVNTVLPVLASHNLLSTQCFMTQFAEQSPAAIQPFKNAGHEICSHTVTHPFLTQLNDTNLAYELSHSQEVLRTMTGDPINNFASPYGDYNAHVNEFIRQYYRSHRTVDDGYNSKDNFNIYKIRVQNMGPTTPLSEFQGWLDNAKATKTWLVLVYHRVTTENAGPYDTYTQDFSEQMQAVSNSGITVKTYNAALDELVAQL
jgi:peptidoglycan/xylan/chitin deacetylase (PgdA/CDA1 family)